VTAQDFVYGFTRALDPATASPAAYILAPYVVGGEAFNTGAGSADGLGVKALDEYTFQVPRQKISLYIRYLWNYQCQSDSKMGNWCSGDSWDWTQNINTYGPFALKAWEHENSITMVKNPFWQGSDGIKQPKLDQITFRLIDAATALSEFEAGNLDATQIPSDQVVRVQADSNLKIS